MVTVDYATKSHGSIRGPIYAIRLEIEVDRLRQVIDEFGAERAALTLYEEIAKALRKLEGGEISYG